MRGVVGLVILLLARRWVCCRLLLRVRADLGLREVGVLGLERDGMIVGGWVSKRRGAGRIWVWLVAVEVAA